MESERYDAVVVGASLAGCTAAILLGRAGARVGLVERRADPEAFKRICGHFIQSSAVPAMERIGLLGAIERAGGVRTRPRLWTRWGWIDMREGSTLPACVNIRRERLDPLLRGLAADTPGVELITGWSADRLIGDRGGFSGVEVSDRNGQRRVLRSGLVVGADGRDSQVARLANVRSRTSPHGRFSYAGYYDGPPPVGSPNSTVWMLDPQWAAAFPTDSGLTMYGCLATRERLPEFRRDLEGAFTSFMADLPDAPPILASRRVGPIIGKIEMPNVWRDPGRRGLALIGDASLATDPLWGVGCGWAFQTAEWLADSVAPALAGEEPVERALRRYRRRHARGLRAHAWLIHDYATGRRFNATERLLFSAAAADKGFAARLEAFGTRNAGPERLATPGIAAAVLAASVRRLARARTGRTAAPGLGTAS
jgi:2-polyprenyl-6-methoxyphenol hydroxylase-like FAD-dependent oxidoreductase